MKPRSRASAAPWSWFWRVHCKSLMQSPWTNTASLPVASGKASASAALSRVRARPSRRNRIFSASGLPVSARWSPTTPFRRGERSLAPARHRPVVRFRGDERRGGASQPEGAADAAIDELRDAARDSLRERGEAWRVENGIVHVLDEAGNTLRRVRSETAEAEDVGERKGGGFCRHENSFCAWRRGIIKTGPWSMGHAPTASGRTPVFGLDFSVTPMTRCHADETFVKDCARHWLRNSFLGPPPRPKGRVVPGQPT